MRKIYFSALLVLTLALSHTVSSQIVINEFCAANKNNYAAANGKYYDWIELYNTTGAAVNIGGWYLSDNPSNITKYQIPAGITINANGYRVFFCSAKGTQISGQYHTNFKLTQSDTSESIILTNSSSVILDSLTIFPCDSNDSRGRTTNGAATWSIFQRPTPNASNNTQTPYPSYVPKVQFSIPAGFYGGAQSVTLTCSQPNTTIRYTLNGAIPRDTSTVYTGPVNITNTRVLRARAFDNTSATIPSITETNTYFINENHTLPVVSVTANTYSTTNPYPLRTLDYHLGNGNLVEQFGNLEFFSSGNQKVFEIAGEFTPHGNDSWAYDQRGFDFDIEDQYGQGDLINNKLFYTSPRRKFKWLIFKAGASDNFPDGGSNPPTRCAHIRDFFNQTLAEKFNMDLDVRRGDHCIVFVNGQYWGVYEFREKVDEDYFDYYYDQPEDSVDNLKYWGGLNIDMGSDTAWINLYNFVVANNMTVPANYQHVADRLDFVSLIDMIAHGIYTVNSDWINWNTAWWRGRSTPNNVKWKYWLWDTDNTWNLGQNYTGWPTTSMNANPCDIDDASGGQFSNPNIGPNEGHLVIFNKLMTNPDFEALYINRMAELLNGPFNCTNMLNHLDSCIARIQPEMQRHINKWGSTYTQWQNNVTYLRNQISARCAVFNNAFDTCYDVQGPYHLAVDVYPAGGGTVTIGNTVTPANYVYTSNYFGGINVSFKAHPNPGYVFSHWQTVSHPPLPNANVDSMYFDFGSTPDSVVAVFINTDSVRLTVITNPIPGGNITVNGITPPSYPHTFIFADSTIINVTESANTGYTFQNWTIQHHTLLPNNISSNVGFMITQDDTLIANYLLIPPDTFTLTVMVNPAGGGNVSVNGVTPGSYPAQMQFQDSTILALIATPNIGYTFTNWTILHHTLLPNSTSPTAGFMILQDDTLVANFALIPDSSNLTVLVNPLGGGNVTVDGNALSVYPTTLVIPTGNSVNITATPNTGYNFVNWTLIHHSVTPNNSSINGSFTITQDDTLIANFALIPDSSTLTVLVNPAGGGSVTVNGNALSVYPTSIQFPSSTLVNISELPNTGYNFVNWTLIHHTLNPNNTSANADFTITQDDTLIANFALIPDSSILIVLVNPVGAGNVTVNGNALSVYPAMLQFPSNSLVDISELPNTGYNFVNWSLIHHSVSPNNTSASGNFTITQDDTLVANYSLIPIVHEIVVQAFPPNGGSVTVNGTTVSTYPTSLSYPDNTLLNVSASAAGGFMFINWQLVTHTPLPTATSNPMNFTVLQSDTIYAYFNLVPVDSNIIWVDVQSNGMHNPFAGNVSVASFTPPSYPWTFVVADGTLLDFEAIPNVGYSFDNYRFIYHAPAPNSLTPIVFINTQHPDSVFVNFKEETVAPDTAEHILLPTGFSPDGDGVNEIFKVVGEQMAEFHMLIYNRWGQKVFESNNQGYGWNGKDLHDKKCDLGVYAYILNGKRLNGEEVKKKGTVTLLR